MKDVSEMYNIKKETLISTSITKRRLFFCGIYFLIKKNEIVYVGKTKIGYKRILQHSNNKDFDSFNFIECLEKELDSLETYFILKYNPKYNKSLNEDFFTLNYINTICKKIFGNKNIRIIKKIIKENNIIPIKKENGNHFYNKKQIKIIIDNFGRF